MSSKVGCRKDLVQEGENGCVFEDGDEDGLLQALKRTLETDLASWSENALAMMRRWNYDYYLQCFLGAIEHAGADKIGH